MPKAAKRNTFTAPTSAVRELEKEAENVDPMEAHRASRVSDREDEYKVPLFLSQGSDLCDLRPSLSFHRRGGIRVRNLCLDVTVSSHHCCAYTGLVLRFGV